MHEATFGTAPHNKPIAAMTQDLRCIAICTLHGDEGPQGRVFPRLFPQQRPTTVLGAATLSARHESWLLQATQMSVTVPHMHQQCHHTSTGLQAFATRMAYGHVQP